MCVVLFIGNQFSNFYTAVDAHHDVLSFSDQSSRSRLRYWSLAPTLTFFLCYAKDRHNLVYNKTTLNDPDEKLQILNELGDGHIDLMPRLAAARGPQRHVAIAESEVSTRDSQR